MSWTSARKIRNFKQVACSMKNISDIVVMCGSSHATKYDYLSTFISGLRITWKVRSAAMRTV